MPPAVVQSATPITAIAASGRMLNTEETAQSFMVARTVDTAAAAHDQELNAQLLAINQLAHRSVSKLRAYGDTKRTILELLREPTTAVLRGADACWAARLLAGVDTAVEELVD